MKKEVVQSDLISSARKGEFYRVTYSEDLPVVHDDVKIDPRTVKCNEISMSFEPDSRHGKRYRIRKQNWRFRLYLGFDKEVTIERWIDELCESPLKITETDGTFIGIAELTALTPSHPTTNSSSKGSEFILDFSINPFRKQGD